MAVRTISTKRVTTTGALVLGLAALAAACSDSGSTDLLPNGQTPANDTTPTDNGVPPPDSSDAGSTASPDSLKAMFEALYPDFNKACGTCHDTGISNAPRFLDASDPYKAIKGYKGIIVKDVTASRLLVVGAATGHTGGPGVTGALKDEVVAWLTAEAAAIAADATPVIDAIPITEGANTIDVSKSGTGVDGTKLTFMAKMNGTILDLSAIQLVAPAATAVAVKKPQFIIVKADATEIPDPVDNFDTVDAQVAAGQAATLGVGQAVFTSWSDGAKIKVKFSALTPTKINAGGGGGCKNVAGFTTNAKPQLQQCLGCHGTAGANKGSLDLSGLQNNDDAAACGQALTKVNLTTKTASKILTHPVDGREAPNGHPLKLAGANATAYDTGVLTGWINGE